MVSMNGYLPDTSHLHFTMFPSSPSTGTTKLLLSDIFMQCRMLKVQKTDGNFRKFISKDNIPPVVLLVCENNIITMYTEH